jgi:hypothetical protein
LVFKEGEGGPILAFKGGVHFQNPLEYIKFDEVREKTYTNRKWQMKWNPNITTTTTKWWVLLWEYCKGT